MKKLLGTIGGGVLAIVVVILLTVAVIIALPIDYIQYKTSHVYRKDRRKYSFFAASSSNFKTYNAALREHIPLEFVESPQGRSFEFGYLVLGRTLVVSNVYNFNYDESAGHWVYQCENEHGELITTSLDEYIETSIDEANSDAGRVICDSVVFLIERTDEGDLGPNEHPSFIVYDGDVADALKELLHRTE